MCFDVFPLLISSNCLKYLVILYLSIFSKMFQTFKDFSWVFFFLEFLFLSVWTFSGCELKAGIWTFVVCPEGGCAPIIILTPAGEHPDLETQDWPGSPFPPRPNNVPQNRATYREEGARDVTTYLEEGVRDVTGTRLWMGDEGFFESALGLRLGTNGASP